MISFILILIGHLLASSALIAMVGDIYKLHNGQYDYEKFSIYFQKMLRERKRISIDEIDVKHLNKELIMRTYDLWDNVKRNYEFLGSSVEFEEAVYYTKGVLTDQILKLRRNHG